jgi:UTP--glucose-1-phosphate uridylyltransferase
VHGVIFRGRRYDTGDRLDYLKAIVQIAVAREDLGPDLLPWLKEFATTAGPAETAPIPTFPALRPAAVTPAAAPAAPVAPAPAKPAKPAAAARNASKDESPARELVPTAGA